MVCLAPLGHMFRQTKHVSKAGIAHTRALLHDNKSVSFDMQNEPARRLLAIGYSLLATHNQSIAFMTLARGCGRLSPRALGTRLHLPRRSGATILQAPWRGQFLPRWPWRAASPIQRIYGPTPQDPFAGGLAVRSQCQLCVHALLNGSSQ